MLKKINKQILFGTVILISIIIIIGFYILINNLNIKQETKKIQKDLNIKTLKKGKINIEKNHKYKVEKNEKLVINISDKLKKLYLNKKINIAENVVIKDKTPIIYRSGDKIEIGAEIFNNTDKKIGLNIKFKSSDIKVEEPIRKIFIEGKSSEIINFWTIGNLNKSINIKYIISALGNSLANSYKLEKIIVNKNFPALNSTFEKGGIAEKNIKQDFKIKIPKNTDLKKSKVRISFSNNLSQGTEKIIKSLFDYPYGSIEQTTSTTYSSAVILNSSKIFKKIITQKEAKEKLELGIKKIKLMQTKNGGFVYWKGKNNPNIHITPYVIRKLVDIKNLGVNIPENLIKDSSSYLEKNFGNITENIDRTETFYTFSKIGKAEFAHNKLLKGIDKSNFSRHELISYTYGLITWNKEKNKETIEKNIKKIITKLDNDKYKISYWSAKSDKALFTSMLIDYGYDKKTINKYIRELYNINWSNYYYSTITKNNVFIAFNKYIKKYTSNSLSNFAFSIGYIQNRDKRFWLGGKQPNTITREFILDDVVQYKEDVIELTTYVISGKDIFTNLTLEAVPKDKLKIKETSNNMKVSKKIYKISDGKEVIDGIYKKGELYKIKVNINLEKEKLGNKLALENYIPSAFKIIDFKLNKYQILTGKEKINNGNWCYIEYLEDRIFAYTNQSLGKNISFEYVVKPEFRGSFIYPPVNIYMIYNGETNAHSKFESIKVK